MITGESTRVVDLGESPADRSREASLILKLYQVYELVRRRNATGGNKDNSKRVSVGKNEQQSASYSCWYKEVIDTSARQLKYSLDRHHERPSVDLVPPAASTTSGQENVSHGFGQKPQHQTSRIYVGVTSSTSNKLEVEQDRVEAKSRVSHRTFRDRSFKRQTRLTSVGFQAVAMSVTQ